MMRRQSPFEQFSGEYEEFDWDDAKRLWTIAERGIDFADVALFFFGKTPFFRRRQLEEGQERWQAFGYLHGDPERLISVVYMEQDEGRVCRLISVRAAHPTERKDYHAAIQAE